MRPNRLLYVFLAFHLTFFGGGSYYNLVFPVRVLHHVLITLVLGFWLLRRMGNTPNRSGLPVTPLNTPLFAMMSVWVLSAIFALYPRMALEYLWFGLTHVVLFFVIVDLLQRGHQRMVLELVFFMATLVVFITGIELASWYFGLGIVPGTQVGWIASGQIIPPLSQIPTVSMAMGISTLLASYVAPLITVSITWAITVKGRDYRFVLWVLAILLAVILLLTRSRGGFLSIAVGLGAFATLQAIQVPRITRLIAPKLLLGVSGLVGMGVVVAFVALTFSRGDSGNSNAGRLDMWRSAIAMTGDNPVLGVGYGMFGRAFRDYRDPNIAQDKLASAHNVYLNTLAETGIVGALIASWLLFVCVRSAWQNWQNAPDRPKQIRIEGAVCALVGLGVHSVVDVFSVTPIVLLVLVLIAYVITPLPATRLVTLPQGRRLPNAILLVGVVLFGIWFVQLDRAQSAYMKSFSRESITEALSDTYTAQSLDPSLTLYSLHEAYLLGIGDDPSAMVAFETATTLEPTWDVGWVYLAKLAEKSGDTANAFRYIDRAIHLNGQTELWVQWARLAEQTDSAPDERIVQAYSDGIWRAFDKQWVLPLAPFWTQTPLRQQAIEQFAQVVGIDWQYRLWTAHNPTRLSALVSDNPQTAREWWVLGEYALTQENNATKAQEAFTQAIALNDNLYKNELGDYYASRARAFIAQNNIAQAQNDLQQAQLLGTWFEYPNAIQAQFAPPNEAETLRQNAYPSRNIPQEFTAVMFGNRPSIFDIPPAMMFPAR
jgi:putative inorganic carbon (HCO3(-)) transporter